MSRLILDTNICERIAASPYCADVIKRLRSRHTIAASANTILELLQGVCRSNSEHHLTAHQERLRVAVGSGSMASAKVLDHPVEFVFLHGTKIKIPGTGKGTKKLHDLVKVVLKAKSHHELKIRGVEWPLGTFRRFLKCEEIEHLIATGKYFYRMPLNIAKAKDLSPDDQATWTRSFAATYRVSLDDVQIQALASATDAAYKYQREVWTMSQRQSFKPEKNENDWMDMNQLLYLADPAVEVVTEEKKIRSRCGSSPQAKRIVLLKELMDREGLIL